MAPDTASARDAIHTALGIVTGEVVGGEAELASYLDIALTLLDGEQGATATDTIEGSEGAVKGASAAYDVAKKAYMAAVLVHVRNLARDLNPDAVYVGVNASSAYDKGRTWPTYHAEGVYNKDKQPLTDSDGERIGSDHLDDIDSYVWDLAAWDEDVGEDDHVTWLLNLDDGTFEGYRGGA